MEYNKDLSIVISLFNEEESLTELINWIEKVMADHGYRYEIILVDDGSTDVSGQICDVYAEKYPNVRVIHKVNGGLSSARNAGLELAKGEYIMFVDSDDTLLPDALERRGNDARNADHRSLRGSSSCALRSNAPGLRHHNLRRR